MLTTDQQRRLRKLEQELRRSDPWLAKSLATHGLAGHPPQHRLARRPLRQRLARAVEWALVAWMDGARERYMRWPGHRWF